MTEISPEDALKIFHDCGLGPSEVTQRIRYLAESLSSGLKLVTGPEFQRSKRTYLLATELRDILVQEMKTNSRRARENPELHEACRREHWKFAEAIDGLAGLNRTELVLRASWAHKNSCIRLRCFVAAQVFFILKESGCEDLAFPDQEDIRVIRVTTKLLQKTVEQGAMEDTVRQNIKRLKHDKPTGQKSLKNVRPRSDRLGLLRVLLDARNFFGSLETIAMAYDDDNERIDTKAVAEFITQLTGVPTREKTVQNWRGQRRSIRARGLAVVRQDGDHDAGDCASGRKEPSAA